MIEVHYTCLENSIMKPTKNTVFQKGKEKQSTCSMEFPSKLQ
jgi:hypothetical protein